MDKMIKQLEKNNNVEGIHGDNYLKEKPKNVLPRKCYHSTSSSLVIDWSLSNHNDLTLGTIYVKS